MTYKELEKAKDFFINKDIEIHFQGYCMNSLLKATVIDITDNGSEITIKTNIGNIHFDLQQSNFTGMQLGQHKNEILYIQLLRNNVI